MAGFGAIARGLIAGLLLGLGFILAPPASAQVSQQYWACGTNPTTGSTTWCPTATATPLPTTGSATISGPLPTGSNVIGTVNLSNEYPVGATVVTSTATNAAAANNLNFAAVPGKFNYICGFAVTGAGATAGSGINVLVNNVGAGFIAYRLIIPTGPTVSITPLVVSFSPCLKANAVNTALTMSVPSFGAGNTDAAANMWGYVL